MVPIINQKTAILLANYNENKEDTGLLKVYGETLAEITFYRIREFFDKVFVIVNDSQQQGRYEKLFAEDVVVSTYGKGILSKTLMGLKACRSKYAFVASTDMPLIEKSSAESLYKNIQYEDFSAVVPRHDSGKTEPLHSVYHVKETINAIPDALSDEKLRFENVFLSLKNVKYVPASGFPSHTFSRVISNIDFEKIRNSLEKKVYRARIEKAERLAENIKMLDTPNAVYFKIPGTKEPHEVRYVKRTKKWACDCRYFSMKRAYCSHILAAQNRFKQAATTKPDDK